MSRIGDARNREQDGEYDSAADLYLREMYDKLVNSGFVSWSFASVTAIGYGLRATYCATRADETPLADIAFYTVVGLIRGVRSQVEAELGEYPTDNRCFLAYLHEWEGDALLYRERETAYESYREAEKLFQWVVENGSGTQIPEYACGGWASERGTEWAFYTFENYLDRRGKSWPDDPDEYMFAALPRIAYKLQLTGENEKD